MLNYNNFKNLNYKKSNRKLSKLRELINKLYGDYEYKKKLIEDLNGQLKRIKINIPTVGEEVLADLEVVDIVSVDKEHYLEFAITIKNIGEVATTEETNLILTVGDIEVELMVSVLAVNEEAVRYTSFPYNPDAVDTYSLNVKSEVNEERNIEESNYTNNILEKSFIIKENYGTGFISHVHNEEGIEFNSLLDQWYAWSSGELVASPLGGSAFSESDHNIFVDFFSGTFDIGVKHRYSDIQRALTTMTIVEDVCTTVVMILHRVTTPVFLDRVDDFGDGYFIYYYRFLKYHTDGTPFGIQGASPIAIVDAGEYWDAIFDSPQSLIANNVPYDLAGTGVKG